MFDSNELLETKLLAGSSGYDIVVPSATFLSRQIEAGVFQPLDKSKLKHLDSVWGEIVKRTAKFDPDNTCANGNKAAQAFVDTALLENPAIYPTE